MRHKISEADMRRKTRMKAISDFIRRMMPDREIPASFTEPEPHLAIQLIVPKVEAKTPPPPPLPLTPRRRYKDDDVTEGVQT